MAITTLRPILAVNDLHAPDISLRFPARVSSRVTSSGSTINSAKHSQKLEPCPNVLQLTHHDIKKLRLSWNLMLNDIFEDLDSSEDETPRVTSGAASSVFCNQLYHNIIKMEPDIENLFPTIEHQAKALSGVITMAVSHLENLQLMDTFLECVGRRHNRVLNIEAAQFELMAHGLLNTFEDRFGEMFTPELEDLWIRLYGYLAGKLLEAYQEDRIMGLDVESSFSSDILNDLFDSVSSVSVDLISMIQKQSLNSLETSITKVSSDDTMATNSKKKSGFSMFGFHRR